MRIKNTVLSLVSLALIGAGIALIATFFLEAGAGRDSDLEEAREFNVPVLEENTEVAEGPEDKTLMVTIPKMEVADATVPDAAGDDEEKLRENLGIHLKGTGFPWQRGANVYIAGHRLGFPNTESFLAFWVLDALENGDEIIVEDANGKKYTYKVFKEFVVEPTNLSVTEPVPGKDVLTLQTCTLPDYSQRLVVQAEKVA